MSDVSAVLGVSISLRAMTDSVYSDTDSVVCLIRWRGDGPRAHGHHGPLCAGARPPRAFGLWDGWRGSLGDRECRARGGTGYILP